MRPPLPTVGTFGPGSAQPLFPLRRLTHTSLMTAPAPGHRPVDVTPVGRPPDEPPHPRPTVFVAEDEPDLLELVEVFLEMDGFDVIATARDGGEALQRYLAYDPPPIPNVVVLDNRMPVLDGLEVAQRILDHHPPQVVVLFTANLDERTEARARDIGVSACVSKRDAAELSTVLRDLLAA